jgi:hypothetical protein
LLSITDTLLGRNRRSRPRLSSRPYPKTFAENSFERPGFATLGEMVFGLVRRVFGLACFFLVTYAAITVPVGRRTAWGHAVAIFTAPPAREAAEDLENIAAEALHRRLPTTPASPEREQGTPKAPPP